MQQLIRVEELKSREVFPGHHARFIHGDHMTIAYWRIDKGATVPEHSHPHEQWTLLLTGSLELTVSGVAHVLRPGQILYIAPHERHSARALKASVVLDVFHPPRDDYR